MKRLMILSIAVLLASCVQKGITLDGEKTISVGMQSYQKGDYKKAKEELKKAIFKSEGLTPRQIMDARFALADSYYNREEYVDAIAEFEEFILLYPTSEKIPEALYKLSMSYMMVSPDYRRDLTYVKRAEEKAQELIESFPDSKFAIGGKEIIKKVNEIKAKHTLYIAETYEKYGKPYSASIYYSEAYEKYRDYLKADYVAYKLAYNLSRIEYQYSGEIERYKERVKEIDKEIAEEKNLERKNVLLNRKKILQDHINVLRDRMIKAREKAVEIIDFFPKVFPNSPYLFQIKELEKESKVDSFIKNKHI